MDWVKLDSKFDRRPPPTANRGGTLFLGLLVIAIGIAMHAAGRWLPVQPAGSEGFHAVMYSMGMLFVAFGIFVVNTGWRGVRAKRRAAARQRRHPGSPWLADFDWDAWGIEDALHLRWREQA